jgi:hypothetical protein
MAAVTSLPPNWVWVLAPDKIVFSQVTGSQPTPKTNDGPFLTNGHWHRALLESVGSSSQGESTQLAHGTSAEQLKARVLLVTRALENVE